MSFSACELFVPIVFFNSFFKSLFNLLLEMSLVEYDDSGSDKEDQEEQKKKRQKLEPKPKLPPLSSFFDDKGGVPKVSLNVVPGSNSSTPSPRMTKTNNVVMKGNVLTPPQLW